VTDDIGGRLQRAREHRGMSLRDAAARTKLPIAVLAAIERNDFASLPGGMFRKAYVRTLAAEVGLDPDAIAAGYCARFERPIEPARHDRNDGRQQDLIAQLAPSRRRSIVTLAVLAATAVTWLMLQPRPAPPPMAFDGPADDLAAALLPPRAAVTLTADRPRAATPTPIAAQTTGERLRIELAATGWCWVAAETDGVRVMYRLVQPGEHVVLEAERLISVRLGDAGSVMVSINGGARRSPGGHGQVVDLEVTPDTADRFSNPLNYS
jgi:transcriptional regulator with XRE-family HTH domain